MESPQQSFIPIAVKRASMSSPLGPLPSTSPSTSRSHRRRTSALSATSGDESYYRPASVRSAHSRLAASVSGTDALGSPVTTRLSLDGSSTPNGEYDAEVEDSEGVYVTDVDRVRAPTKSSLSKRREKSILPQTSASQTLTRRAATPAQDGAQRSADERLGLSRIPRAAVTHAVSLHPSAPRLGPSPAPSEADPGDSQYSQTPSSSPLAGKGPPFVGLSPHTPGSASRPAPGSAGKSSRMIDALQTELESTKAQLERAKGEVRNCRREIGTLTRRSEDLRETRDRMRSEAESLNNVISRKERMIADVLGRARTAEAAVAQHASERKELEARTKKAVADAAAEVVTAVAAREKAESESDSLRDSVRSLRDEWGRQAKGYRDELSQLRDERNNVAGKSQAVLTLVQKQSEEHKNVVALVDEVNAKHLAATKAFEIEVKSLRGELSTSVKQTEDARYIARTLAAELARLRRLARQPPRADLEAIIAAEVQAVVSGRDLLESEPDHPDHLSIITPAPPPTPVGIQNGSST